MPLTFCRSSYGLFVPNDGNGRSTEVAAVSISFVKRYTLKTTGVLRG
jgi:hypothetical protein